MYPFFFRTQYVCKMTYCAILHLSIQPSQQQDSPSAPKRVVTDPPSSEEPQHKKSISGPAPKPRPKPRPSTKKAASSGDVLENVSEPLVQQSLQRSPHRSPHRSPQQAAKLHGRLLCVCVHVCVLDIIEFYEMFCMTVMMCFLYTVAKDADDTLDTLV